MSEIVYKVNERNLAHIVMTTNGDIYYVDSCDTIDQGFETMIFKWNEHKKEVSDWSEEYAERYKTENEMRLRHYQICKRLEEYL